MNKDSNVIRCERKALLWTFLGVLGFSGTLPATRLAAPYLGAVQVGLGRAVVAALCGALLLWITRSPRPSRQQWKGLTFVALGVVLGFPWLSAWALQYTSATRAAVIIALAPFFTAVVSALREGSRPTARFWIGSLFGTSLVVLFLFSSGSATASTDFPVPVLFGRQLAWLPEGALALAALLAAVGYTEGTRLTRELGGLQVISWALLGALPVVLALLFVHGASPWSAPPSAWWGFAYVSLISMFVAFFFWYGGLAQAGITRASQVQLVQPLLSVTWAVLLLGERFSFGLIVTALGVVLAIVVAVRRPRGVSRFPTHAGERASRVEAA